MPNDLKTLICPLCNGQHFQIKYEATYVYSYEIDVDAPGNMNTKEFLPFQYDNREQTDSCQYLQCQTCGEKYPCYLNDWKGDASMKYLQDVINSSFNR